MKHDFILWHDIANIGLAGNLILYSKVLSNTAIADFTTCQQVLKHFKIFELKKLNMKILSYLLLFDIILPFISADINKSFQLH